MTAWLPPRPGDLILSPPLMVLEALGLEKRLARPSQVRAPATGMCVRNVAGIRAGHVCALSRLRSPACTCATSVPVCP